MGKETKKRKTYKLKLTKFELIHIRDLFSLILAQDPQVTASQALATKQERSIVEGKLWRKVVTACQEAKIPLGDDAPDFIVAAQSNPTVGVFELAYEPAGSEEDEDGDEITLGDEE